MNQELPTIAGLRCEDFTRELPGKLADILEHIWAAPDRDLIESYRCARDSIESYFYHGIRVFRVSREFFDNMVEMIGFTADQKDNNFQAELLNMFFLAIRNVIYINDPPVFSNNWVRVSDIFADFIKGMGALDTRLYFVAERFSMDMSTFPHLWESVYDSQLEERQSE